MQEGIIFIANSRGRKVMEFSSYGDLLSLYYNQSQNPIPVLLQSANDGNRVSSRAALSFPFLDVGEIAVSDSGILFVEDAIPENRAEYDEEQKAYLDRVVRRFDRSGIYLDYLGQEGVGGNTLSLHKRPLRQFVERYNRCMPRRAGLARFSGSVLRAI